MSQQVRQAIETIREHLSFREIVELVKGSNDVEKRAHVILDPRVPETSTFLTSNQVEFIAIAMSIKKTWPEFEGLEDYAQKFLHASTSKDGWGVDRMIAHEQAIAEKRLMQLGLRPQGEAGKDVKQKG